MVHICFVLTGDEPSKIESEKDKDEPSNKLTKDIAGSSDVSIKPIIYHADVKLTVVQDRNKPEKVRQKSILDSKAFSHWLFVMLFLDT